MDRECAACAELWRQHQQAAGACEAAVTRLRMAGAGHDHHEVKRLLAEVRSAAGMRAEVELRIERHEHNAHPDGTVNADIASQPPVVDGLRLCDVERTHIERIVAETGRNLAKAARILDIDRSTLYSKLKRYGLK